MEWFPSYDSIKALSHFSEDRRYAEFRKAHKELKSASLRYRQSCRRYEWSIWTIFAATLTSFVLSFFFPLANLFASLLSIFGGVAVVVLSSRHQRFIVSGIDDYLNLQASGKPIE